jgi:hypothetical protein
MALLNNIFTRYGSWFSGLIAGLCLGLYLSGYIREPYYLDGILYRPDGANHDVLQLHPHIVVTGAPSGRGTNKVNSTTSHKVIVWTTDYFTGGPEALFQLVLALHRRGHTVYRTSDLAPALQSFYPDWAVIPSIPFPEIDRVVAPGDVIIIPEEQPCPDLGRFPFGVRKVKWILAGDSHDAQPPCTLLHHSFELARANRSPMSTVLMPYIHRNRSGFVQPDVAASKRNTVCVATHNVPRLADELRDSTYLRHQVPNLDVKLIQGLTPQEVVDLLNRCKVMVDGNLPGLERLPLEAATFGAVLVFDPSRGIPENVLDLPVPADYLGPWPDDRNEVDNSTRLERAVAKALLEYPRETQRFDPLRKHIEAMEAHFVATVDRTFRQAAAFLVPCDGSTDEELCLLAAVSVLLVNPLSLVHIILGGGHGDSRNAYTDRHADLLATIRAIHMEGLVTIHEEAATNDNLMGLDDIYQSAPNQKLFVLAADTMHTRFSGGASRSTAVVSAESFEIPRPLSWAKLRELSQKHQVFEIDSSDSLRRGQTSEDMASSISSIRPLLEGTVFLGQQSLTPFIVQCSERLWQTVIRHSPRWEQLCKATTGSIRLDES